MRAIRGARATLRWKGPTCCSLQLRRVAAGVSEPAFSEVRWLRFGAAGIAVGGAGLILTGGPLLAKEPDTRQEVWVWGRRQSIPGGADGDLLRPCRIKWFETHKPGWKKISFGPSFGAALDQEGQVFIWGETLGESQDAFVGPLAMIVEGDAKGKRFVDVQCSSSHVFLLTAKGHALVVSGITESLRAHAGTDGATASHKPVLVAAKLVPGLPKPGRFAGEGIKQMSIGLEHAAFVTSRGALICFGGNEWGQCGEKPPREKAQGALEEKQRVETEEPVLVSLPNNAGPIVSATVGGRHTVAIDAYGQAFAFGDDRRIQLGLGDTRSGGVDERNALGKLHRDYLGGKDTKTEIKRAITYRYYDQHMQAAPVQTVPPPATNRPDYPPPSFLACGEDFTIFAHRDSPDWYSEDQETNVLFCCGENAEGQCGRNKQNQQQPWQAVRLPKRSRTVAVACGQGHSLCLLTTGQLYGWGLNQQGELGIGHRAAVCPPVRVRIKDWRQVEDPEENSRKITVVSCGFRNSAVICEVPLQGGE